MMRLIDAEILRDRLYKTRNAALADGRNKAYGKGFRDAIEILEAQPTVEPELLKEQEGIVPYIDIDEAKCPVCKVKLTRQELIGDDVLFEDFFDYCPHCGKPVLWEGR